MFIRIILASIIALTIGGSALADSGRTHHVRMTELNTSGQVGTTTLKAVPGGVLVKVTLSNEPTGASEPAHIHNGTCADGVSILRALHNVVHGSSVTTLKGLTLEKLNRGGKYSVNVHKSAADLKTYVSCGDFN